MSTLKGMRRKGIGFPQAMDCPLRVNTTTHSGEKLSAWDSLAEPSAVWDFRSCQATLSDTIIRKFRMSVSAGRSVSACSGPHSEVTGSRTSLPYRRIGNSLYHNVYAVHCEANEHFDLCSLPLQGCPRYVCYFAQAGL